MAAAAKAKKARSKKGARKKKSAARRSAAQTLSLAGALAEAAWAEADSAFAQALADFDEVETAQTAAARIQAVALLGQSLSRAARRRGLTRVGVLGASEPFDPGRHDLAASGKPKTVRITARGVARGGELLVKPRAAPARGKKK